MSASGNAFFFLASERKRERVHHFEERANALLYCKEVFYICFNNFLKVTHHIQNYNLAIDPVEFQDSNTILLLSAPFIALISKVPGLSMALILKHLLKGYFYENITNGFARILSWP